MCYSTRRSKGVKSRVEDWNERIIFPFNKIDMNKPFAMALYYGNDKYIGEILLPFSEVYSTEELNYENITVSFPSSSDS